MELWKAFSLIIFKWLQLHNPETRLLPSTLTARRSKSRRQRMQEESDYIKSIELTK
jgi:hypothetical protein